ncbi:hypothetical protein QR680_010834 [Steinernema hermaphroditum]|uniref:Uncharacterized protein n=1 Tax=Steinernema hermaphroditum TaxID=289476 RepID=A0AA39IRF7_9BILA|nr:hypothetical protein QR680_010834 [Steinernema hermaphroditum]
MFLLLLTFLHLLQTAHGLLCHKFMYDTHKGFQTNVTVERSLSDDPYCISFHDSQQNQMFFGPQDSHDFCQPGSSTSSEVAFSSCNRCNWDFCDLEYMPESVRNVAKKASDGFLQQQPIFGQLRQAPLGTLSESYSLGGPSSSGRRFDPDSSEQRSRFDSFQRRQPNVLPPNSFDSGNGFSGPSVQHQIHTQNHKIFRDPTHSRDLLSLTRDLIHRV